MAYQAVHPYFQRKTVFLILLLLLMGVCRLHAQDNGRQRASKDSNATDTSHKVTVLKGKNGKDSIPFKDSPSALTSQIKYDAHDSIVFDLVDKQVYLYGKANMDYTDINLKADSIRADMSKSEIWAQGRKDSTGKVIGKPVFKEGAESTTSDKMGYNIRTKKGIVFGVVMKEGEGYIHGEVVKTVRTEEDKKSQDVIYIKNAKYTTCNLEHPHFYLQATKMKVMPKDKIITGPARMVIEDVPIPIVLPFGFFPAESRKSSGIIIPTFGESATQGYALRNGGFYYGGSEYFDAALTGDLYTGGSYRINMMDRYALRYRFAGNLSLSYARNQIGLVETPDYSVQQNYFITWHHQIDGKSHPGTSFSADVNTGSTNYLKNNSFQVNTIATQNLTSSVAYSKSFLGTPFSLSLAARDAQSIAQKTTTLTLPDATFAMSRINPFKGRNAVGHKWYHDINVGYTLNVKNQLNTTDSTIHDDLQKMRFESGAQQTIPIGTSVKLFRYFTLNPSVTYNGYIYRTKYTQTYTGKDSIVKSQQNGLYYAQDYQAAANLTTMVYGRLNFRRGKIMAVQHVITPTITAAYRPDFSQDKYGYYGTLKDTLGYIHRYSYFQNSVINTPGSGKVGSLGYSIQNNLEMKVRTAGKDTAHPFKKVKILESFTVSGSYNFLADSMKISPVNISARTTLFGKLGLQGTTLFNPYYEGIHGQTKDLDIDRGGRLAHLSTASLTATYSLNKAAPRQFMPIMPLHNPYLGWYYHGEDYANFNVPWNVSMNYSINYTYTALLQTDRTYTHKGNYTQTVNVVGDFNLTPKWKVAYNTGYDFVNHNFASSQFTVTRDLHCWVMSFQWIPAGPYRSYFFNIHIKASTLQDLKYDKRREYFDFQ